MLNARMNAEGLDINTIKAAIIECGDKARTDGWVKPPRELANMASSDVLTAIYPRSFCIKVEGEYAFQHLPHSHITLPEFLERLEEFPLGTRLECEISGDFHLSIKHVLVEKTISGYAIIKLFDRFEWQFENSNRYFLPDGIRTAVAAKVGADPASSTFHAAFDAIVDGYAIY